MVNDQETSDGLKLLSDIFEKAALTVEYSRRLPTTHHDDVGSPMQDYTPDRFTAKLQDIQGDISIDTEIKVGPDLTVVRNLVSHTIDPQDISFQIDYSDPQDKDKTLKKEVKVADLDQVKLSFSFKDPSGKRHSRTLDISERSAEDIRLIAKAANRRNADFGM